MQHARDRHEHDAVDLAPDPAVVLLAVVYFVLGYLAFGAIFAAIGALALRRTRLRTGRRRRR